MTRVIAEYGQSARGSVETAILQAFAAHEAGCWGVKYQLLTPEKIASTDAPAYWTHARPGQTQAEVFAENGMIPYDSWGPVKEACDDLGITFLATPFDIEAVDALDKLEVAAIKVASGDITYRSLLRAIGSTGRPVIMSCGASLLVEVEQALLWLTGSVGVTLLACDLVYPCPDEAANLARIEGMRREFPGYEIGYSDHTRGTYTAYAAAAMGATILEKHATLDPAGPVPDDAMGMDPYQLALYVAAAECGTAMRGDEYPAPSRSEQVALVNARRSLHLTRDAAAGHTVIEGDLIALRPCRAGYIPASEEEAVYGRQLASDLPSGAALRPSDIVG